LKRFGFIGLILLISISIFSCAKKGKIDTKGKTVLAQVNGRVLIKEYLLNQLPPERKGNLTEDVISELVKKWIDSETVYHQAKKEKLDQDPEVLFFAEEAVKNIIVTKFLEEKFKKIPLPTDEEAKKYYEGNKTLFSLDEVRASHILTPTKEKSEQVLERIKKGEDFAKLASEFSIDPGTKTKGGDLGYFTVDKMLPALAGPAFRLQIGDVTEPIQTEYGYHILKVTDRKSSGKYQDFEKVKPSILMFLENEKQNVLIDSLLNMYKKEVKIQRFDQIGLKKDTLNLK
jgi:peptidyl-prolyl cis-trans isomerase C